MVDRNACWCSPFRLLILATAAFVIAVTASTGLAERQLPSAAEQEAIAYSASTPTDPIAQLQQRIAAGEVELDFDEQHGYLSSLLSYLEIPVSSQGLIFSRTSLQVDRITPWSPRAVYFNDDVYVGWVQGGPVIEIASVDPTLGAVFYTLPQDASEPPTFERQTTTCLMCHDSSSVTGGVPGFIVRSVVTDRYGYAISTLHEGPTTDRTPLEDRWGGWYVTGSSGTGRHAGNTMSPLLSHEVGNVKNHVAELDLRSGGNLTDLSPRFSTKPYLSPHSDIVALLVIAHQATIHNLITIANYETRKALDDEAIVVKVAGRELEPGEHLDSTMIRVERAAEPLVRGMLFVKAALLDAPITGASGFTSEFSSRGPRDRDGRSLRDLDLERSVFRYPLTFLIYSDSFDALPSLVKDHVYRRLREVLSGEDTGEEFVHLTVSDREAILEILADTKPDFAALMTE